MTKYLHVTKQMLLLQLQYKSFFLATLISMLLKILVSLFVWKTIFASQSEVNGYSLATFTTYIIFANLLNNLNNFGIGRDLARSIVRGDITGELLYPYSPITALFFQDFGLKIIEAGKFILVLLVVPMVNPNFYLPDIKTLGIFVLTSLIGMFMVQLMDLGFGLLSFYTVNTWGLFILREGIFSLSAGVLLPLSFYPAPIAKLLSFLPYSFAVNFPITILLEKEVDPSLFWLQLIWAPLLAGLMYVLWQGAKKRLVIFGG
ncbi:ABC transporter permease [Streptococcus marmotae]|uniref:ABC transporter permease n=1 Tax=Streptococcus marmotae TaxID=1825069 RepID=UPI0008319CE2|nr:ABC-2 family transporter protein [Streptococcus marmotae]